MATAHVSPFSGSWYPRNARDLTRLLHNLFTASKERTGDYLLPYPLAFVVPHAGLAYSGSIAASAYRCIQAARPKRIFLFAFCHHGAGPKAAIPNTRSYETPLGELTVDWDAVMQLTAEHAFELVPEAQVCDHSLEMQLPLLQWAHPDAVIVPIYAGKMNVDQRLNVARAVHQALLPGDMLLASSDFTHYGRDFHYVPFPMDRHIASRLRTLDFQTIDASGSLDPSLFLGELSASGCTMCGRDPVALMLAILGLRDAHGIFQQPLDYSTSGEISGDYGRSVSYSALGYFPRESFLLDSPEAEALLTSGYDTLAQYQATGARRYVYPRPTFPALTRQGGVFVSAHRGQEFFGCLGCLGGEQPLEKSVPRLTLAAALDDSRRPRHAGVPQDLELEISLLTPMKRLREWDSIQMGRDGVYLEYGQQSGLLLPQVATEHRMTMENFFEAVSRKAGLDDEAYLDPSSRLYSFQAQIISGRPGKVTLSERRSVYVS